MLINEILNISPRKVFRAFYPLQRIIFMLFHKTAEAFLIEINYVLSEPNTIVVSNTLNNISCSSRVIRFW